jgi:tetratricopeptide (TPR) repeat protein
MNKPLYLSHFTPSMMRADLLERLFVQREDMLQRTVDRVADSILKKTKHHDLFVGPRGIGKTHYISLVHHRLSQRKDLTSRAVIAWMREEEWGITSFGDLLLRILRVLDESYPALKLDGEIAKLFDLKAKDVEAVASDLLLKALDGKTLVLLIENLDDLFLQLKDSGQKSWRAFMQNHPVCAVVGTTPALFSGVQLQKSPFYGFFRTEKMEKFGFEDAVSLLKKIALERGDESLASTIDSPYGRARLRAVDHLAEGNPRIYIIFAQFLTEQTLDTLVDAFMHTLDELTPYYQSRMKELPGQQRKIVEYLCNYRGAAPVKEIAKGCFISHQTCSSQLGELREKGYVKSTEAGRESFYELAEPMMRICLEVKKQRGEPIGIFVQILRIWYTQPELSDWLQRLGDGRDLDRTYIAKALELAAQDREDPKLKPIQAALSLALKDGNFALCHKIMEEWTTIEPEPGLGQLVSVWNIELREGDIASAEVTAQKIYAKDRQAGIIPLLIVLAAQRANKKILELTGTNVELDSSIPDSVRVLMYVYRARCYAELGRYKEAIQDYERLTNKVVFDADMLANQMASYRRLGDWKSATRVVGKLIRLEPANPMWVVQQMSILYSAGKVKASAAAAKALLSDVYADKAVSRLVAAMIKDGDIGAVARASDIEEAKKDLLFCSLVITTAISQGKFDPALLADTVRAIVSSGALASAWGSKATILACYLLHADGTVDIGSLLAEVLNQRRESESLVPGAILLSVPFGNKHGATLTQLEAWKARLEGTLQRPTKTAGISMALHLLDAYRAWKATGDQRIVMRLSDEERKLLWGMDEGYSVPDVVGLPVIPIIDGLFAKPKE